MRVNRFGVAAHDAPAFGPRTQRVDRGGISWTLPGCHLPSGVAQGGSSRPQRANSKERESLKLFSSALPPYLPYVLDRVSTILATLPRTIGER